MDISTNSNSISLQSYNTSESGITTINTTVMTDANNSSSFNNTPSEGNSTPLPVLDLSKALSPLRELYSCLYIGDIKSLMSNQYLNFEENEKIRILAFPEPHFEINEKTQKYFSFQIIEFDSDEDILSISKSFEQYSQLILGRTSTQPVVIQECCFGLILAAIYFIKYELFSLPQAQDLIGYNDFFGTSKKHSHFEKVDSCTLINDITSYYYNNMTKRKTTIFPNGLNLTNNTTTTTTTTSTNNNNASPTSEQIESTSKNNKTSITSPSSIKPKSSGGLLKKLFNKKDKESNNSNNSTNAPSKEKKESKKEREAREEKERERLEREHQEAIKHIPPGELYQHHMKQIQLIQKQQILELNAASAAAAAAANANKDKENKDNNNKDNNKDNQNLDSKVNNSGIVGHGGNGNNNHHHHSSHSNELGPLQNLMDPEMIENYDDGSDRSKNSKTIIAANFNELPEEYKTMVKTWDIKQESIDQHFEIILSLLHFHTKQRFYSSEPTHLHNRPKYYNVGNVCGSCSPPVVVSTGTNGSNNNNNNNNTTMVTQTFYKKPFDQICKKPTNEMKKLYTVREKVGKGGFGTVYLARNNMDKTKSRIAIKKLPHVRKKEKKFNVKEIRVLEFAKHPNIITYYNSHMLHDEVWIAMEFMEGGTLAEASHQYPFQESNIAYVAREVLQGLAYLHGLQLVHRDLKSQNIMMTTSGEIKLIDFGLCANLSKGERIRMCGSPIWMPPEMIQQKQHGYTCDIWSTAICLLELANRNNKLRKNPIKTMFMVGSEGIKEPFEDPNRWSDAFHDIISKCLQMDPHDRPSAEELLKHPFIQLADNKKKMGKILSSIFLKSIVGI